MILAIRKIDEAVFEQVGIDGLNPIYLLKDLSGKEFYDYSNKYKLVFEENSKFNEFLNKRI